MIRVVIAYDNNDGDLGDYFEDCFSNINNGVIANKNIKVFNVPGLDCTENNINQIIGNLSPHPFVFVGLSHGDYDGTVLHTNNGVFVSANNAVSFSDSFFYTTACNAGIFLKDDLLGNGCKCFIGYNKDSWATYDAFHSTYIACENYSINQFLCSDLTIKETYDSMLEYFVNQIELLTVANEILVAMELEHNMNCFLIEGDSSLTRNNFHT